MKLNFASKYFTELKLLSSSNKKYATWNPTMYKIGLGKYTIYLKSFITKKSIPIIGNVKFEE